MVLIPNFKIENRNSKWLMLSISQLNLNTQERAISKKKQSPLQLEVPRGNLSLPLIRLRGYEHWARSLLLLFSLHYR